MIRFVTICFALSAAMAGTASAQSDLVKRGDYLVNTIMTCGNCHTPKGPTGDIMDKAFSGGLSWDEPPFKVTAPNITQDKATGIGSWTDAQIKTLLRTGKRPNGVQIAEVMPTAFYGIITDNDMNAIVAYLRTLKPIANKVPDPIYKMQIPHHAFPGCGEALHRSHAERPGEEGFLPRHHRPLHGVPHAVRSARARTSSAISARAASNSPAPGASRCRATSPRRASASWTDAEIKRAVTTGVSKDGSHLKPPMGFPYYAHMTDADLNAVVAYLRTVPAK